MGQPSDGDEFPDLMLEELFGERYAFTANEEFVIFQLKRYNAARMQKEDSADEVDIVSFLYLFRIADLENEVVKPTVIKLKRNQVAKGVNKSSLVVMDERSKEITTFNFAP